MRRSSLGVFLGVAFLAGTAGACIVYVEDSCESVTCSANAGCERGSCFCDAGFSGNPYNDNGCLPTSPPEDGSVCDPGCGQHAHCSAGGCVCDTGHVAVCGGGNCLAEEKVCDGALDCVNGADEDISVCNASIDVTFLVTDACDDGLDIDWRIYSEDLSWVWPGPDESFRTWGLDVDSFETISCYDGETVCFGASAGSLIWGIGLDGTDSCDACCYTCARGEALDHDVDLGFLTCG